MTSKHPVVKLSLLEQAINSLNDAPDHVHKVVVAALQELVQQRDIAEADVEFEAKRADEWELRALAGERERDAYKKAKTENDERFMTERDQERQRAEKAEAQVERLVENHAAVDAELQSFKEEYECLRVGGEEQRQRANQAEALAYVGGVPHPGMSWKEQHADLLVLARGLVQQAGETAKAMEALRVENAALREEHEARRSLVIGKVPLVDIVSK